jgi:hypothetical protein
MNQAARFGVNVMPIDLDDAIALFVDALREAPPLSTHYNPNARNSFRGCDIQVEHVLRIWWFREHGNKNPMPDPGEADIAPFQDAAWELARRGILRPGPVLPRGPILGGHPNTEGDGFSLTAAGRVWVGRYDQQGPFPLDPSRFALLIAPYSDRFGPAFIQRVTEAAGCYRTMNYFAACAMAGAASESIFVAIGLAQMNDEAKVLRIYLGRDGRRLLMKEISAYWKPQAKQAAETASSLLSYWRDNAAHGYATDISEFAAHDALSRLLRFASFVDSNWAQLIKPMSLASE